MSSRANGHRGYPLERRVSRVAAVLGLGIVLLPVYGGGESARGQGKDAGEGAAGAALTPVESLFPWRDGGRFTRPEGRVPDVLAIAEDADEGLIAWGDQEGNVFTWSSRTRCVSVVNDRTLGAPPRTWREEAIFRVTALRFKDHRFLFWLEERGGIGRADLEDGRFVPRKRSQLPPHSPFGGTLLGDSVVVSETYGGSNFLKMLRRPNVDVLMKRDLETGKALGECEIYPPKGGRYHWVNAMALSPGDKLLAIASENNCGIVDMESFRLARSLGIEFVQSLAFSPDGSRLALATGDKLELLVVEAGSGKVIRKVTMPDGGAWIEPLAFASNESVWFHYWSHLYRLDVPKGEAVKVLEVPRVTALLVSRDGRSLYVGLWNGVLDVYALPVEKEAGKEGGGSAAQGAEPPKP